MLPIVLVVLALPAGAAQLELSRVAPQLSRVVEPAVTASCNGGIKYDDGSFEELIRLPNDSLDAVMRFDLPASGMKIDQICVCWARGSSAPSSFNPSLIFFAADGPGGGPGTSIAVVPTSTPGITVAGGILSYDLTNQSIQATSDRIFAGVRWNGGSSGDQNGIYLCQDLNGPNDRPIYLRQSSNTAWTAKVDAFDPPLPKALGVRLGASEQVQTCPAIPCVPDADTLCLNNDRFRVEAFFDPPNDTDTLLEPAHPTELGTNSDTGYFWFFNEKNVEAVVKTLNACGVNDRYWVFAGGLTNVEVEITVCDTEEGLQRTYHNPQSTAFQPIQDTDAFATCP